MAADHHLPRRALLGGSGALLLAGCVSVPAGVDPLPPRDGTTTFSDWAGPPLRVWTHVPARVGRDTPIVFVMPGVNRDADRYRNEWAPLAARHGFILVVPEFSNADFPGSNAYNSGFFAERDGSPRPRERWSFSAIEPLFDHVRARTGSRVRSYAIYGHSAGGQFVHRFVLFTPEARYHRAVAANAGWYTLPDLDRAFPYGLKNAPPGETALAAALRKPLTVLLGTADNDPNARNLRQAPEAREQGPHRLARGQTFYRTGQAAAARLRVPFGWSMQFVEGVGHENARMAEAATPLLIARGGPR